MPTYTDDDHDEMLVMAARTNSDSQMEALEIVVDILERNRIAYGIMGGMNFFLRGSDRTTQDVDIAVDKPPRLNVLLSLFENIPMVYLPATRMQWVGGIARIFLRVGNDLVQFNLIPKDAEGHFIPANIGEVVDRQSLTTPGGAFDCNLLAIGPLVRCKIKAHWERDSARDYHDLRYIFGPRAFAEQIRIAAPSYKDEWKDAFLEKVREQNPDMEAKVRWGLQMEATPSTPSKGLAPSTPGGSGRTGSGGYGGDYNTGSGPSPGSAQSSSSKTGAYSGYSGANQGSPLGTSNPKASSPGSGMF